MEVSSIIAELNTEIARLQHVVALLSGSPAAAAAPAMTKKGPGRPKGSKNAKSPAPTAAPKKKRTLSPEGRKAIAEAMKKRWAERRKLTAK